MSKCKQTCSVRIGLPCQEDRSAHQSKSRPFTENIFEQQALCSLMPVIAVTANQTFPIILTGIMVFGIFSHISY
jgi:hypothetical protein